MTRSNSAVVSQSMSIQLSYGLLAISAVLCTEASLHLLFSV